MQRVIARARPNRLKIRASQNPEPIRSGSCCNSLYTYPVAIRPTHCVGNLQSYTHLHQPIDEIRMPPRVGIGTRSDRSDFKLAPALAVCCVVLESQFFDLPSMIDPALSNCISHFALITFRFLACHAEPHGAWGVLRVTSPYLGRIHGSSWCLTNSVLQHLVTNLEPLRLARACAFNAIGRLQADTKFWPEIGIG